VADVAGATVATTSSYVVAGGKAGRHGRLAPTPPTFDLNECIVEILIDGSTLSEGELRKHIC